MNGVERGSEIHRIMRHRIMPAHDSVKDITRQPDSGSRGRSPHRMPGGFPRAGKPLASLLLFW